MARCVTVKLLHLTTKKDLFKVSLSGLPNVAVMEGGLETPIDFRQQLLNSAGHCNFPAGSAMFGLLCNSAHLLAPFAEAFYLAVRYFVPVSL